MTNVCIYCIILQCLFEMPIPQVCSQPGARRLDYVNLLQSLQNVLSTMSCIETVYMDAREELSILESAEIQSNISFLLAAIAAILAQAEDVICRMDLFKPCYGSQINWKPKSEEFWEDLDKRVTLSFENLTKSINSEELCISCDSRVIPSVFTRGRAAILLLMDCHELIWKSRKAEQLLPVALQVPLPGSAEVQKDSTEASKEEARKQGLKEKILGNAYLPAILIHTILLSGLGVFLLLVLGTKSLVSGTVKFLSSKEARRQSTFSLQSKSIVFVMNLTYDNIFDCTTCSSSRQICSVCFQVLAFTVAYCHGYCLDTLESQSFFGEPATRCIQPDVFLLCMAANLFLDNSGNLHSISGRSCCF